MRPLIPSSTEAVVSDAGLVEGVRYRPDIEGLRALAVLAVLFFHAGVPGFDGGYVGVDIFFVISGFLISTLLLKEIEATGGVSLTRFYLRRAQRLLPASAAALIFSSALTMLMLPPNRWPAIGGDIVASALYVVNWRLGLRSVDYLAEGSASSPVQHFWSLAVEEQFYFFWPVMLVLAIAMLGLRIGNRRALGSMMLAVVVVSLVWSVLRTAMLPGWAYFATTTRVWELAVGGLLALATPALCRLRQPQRESMALVGLFFVGLAVATYGPLTPFPGYTALLPVVGSALILAAGVGRARSAVLGLLSVGPLVWIGGISYSLYLFHWPIIVAVKTVTDFDFVVGLAAVAVSFAPAWFSSRFIENPVRRAKWLIQPTRRGFGFVFFVTTAGVIAGVLVAGSATVTADSISPSAISALPDVLSRELSDDDVPADIPPNLSPSIVSAGNDKPDVYERGCHISRSAVEPVGCEYGTPGGSIVLLVGDSKAAQWVPAFAQLAIENGWHLHSYTKSGCPLESIPLRWGSKQYDECDEWRRRMMKVIDDLRPEVVVLSSLDEYTVLDADGVALVEPDRSEKVVSSIADIVDQFTEGGYSVAVVADTPIPIGHVPDCLGIERSVSACTAPRSTALAIQLHAVATALNPGVVLVDLTELLCTPTDCPPIVGSTLVYRDEGHLTKTMVLRLADEIDRQLGLSSRP